MWGSEKGGVKDDSKDFGQNSGKDGVFSMEVGRRSRFQRSRV